MRTEVMSQKSYLRSPHAGNVRFDTMTSLTTPSIHHTDFQILTKKHSPMSWELDVKPLISSRKWLQSYGLKKNKLTLQHILPAIGFKLSDDFDESLAMKKPISSRYGSGLYSRLLRPDGKTFNITGSKQQLEQLKKRVEQAVDLYRRRLHWLTTESRRLFGVVEERAVTIVLDVNNMSPQQFHQYRAALETVINEQLSNLSKFNIIRSAEDCQKYSNECVPVTHDTVTSACQWLWELDRLSPVSSTSTCEALLHALADPNNEAVYLFTEGSSIDSSKELLKQKVSSAKLKIPIHVVSYNCSSSDTIRYLRSFAAATKGRFHAYAVVMEMDAFEEKQVDDQSGTKANLVLKRKTYGGLPAGVGVREDVILVFEELEEGRNILQQLIALLNPSVSAQQVSMPAVNSECRPGRGGGSFEESNEQCMSSAQWIKKFGLQTQKLGLYDILSGVAFKHQDGVVDIMEKPLDRSQTDAICKRKLVNARYCDEFPVVRWRDGSVVHVQVTPEVHRHYEQRMQVVLQKIQQRISWLREGSREVFGTVLEDDVYILLDCSASMQASLPFLKDKLFLLMQEQLRHKKRFNFVSFNSQCVPWREGLVEVNERNLQSAWAWVQGLTCWGSTNTYAAISRALTDPNTQAMYLLTDGRPDQPPKSILAQVQLKDQVPIHSISFNCNDKEANRFLYELARTTSGRYHYFSEGGTDSSQPDCWESEDIQLLQQELKIGLDHLEQLASLRDECSSTAWRRHTLELKHVTDGDVEAQGKDEFSQNLPLRSNSENTSQTSIYRQKSAPSNQISTQHRSEVSKSGSVMHMKHSSQSRRQSLGKHTSPLVQKHPLVASHTRTSLLRTLNSCGRFSASEWLLPETKQLFEKQADRQQELQKVEQKNEKLRRKRDRQFERNNCASSKVWLRRNGLAAKKLTILDALSPTMVPHRAKYIPILDKHVVSQVFDQIIPLAHVSSRTKQEIRLVSPNAVDLERYQKEVHRAMESYKQRLDQIVANALPEHQEAGDGNSSFSNNREHLLNLLEGSGWNGVKKEDIDLLEKEIKKAECFIQQAKDLKNVCSDSVEQKDGSECVQAAGIKEKRGISAQITTGASETPAEVSCG